MSGVMALGHHLQQNFPFTLSNERQWYLYEKIRDFCSDGHKRYRVSFTLYASLIRHTSVILEKTHLQKNNVCGNCGRTGHYRNTCKITM